MSLLKAPLKARKKSRTRDQILEFAVDLASTDGLEGLTIGRLAAELGMSKSGLFAHFGSKEALQLAAVGAAADVFAREVENRVRVGPEGLARVVAMVDAWLDYVEVGVFSGGCFFAAASAEFDDRPGDVRDRIAALTAAWLRAIEEQIEEAAARGELYGDSDAGQIAFELHAFVQEANWAFRLHDNDGAFDRARSAVQRTLARAATVSGESLLTDLVSARVLAENRPPAE